MKIIGFSVAAALSAACLMPAAASATVVLDPHPFLGLPLDPTAQIHNNGTQNATTVFGHTVPGNVGYTLTSPTTLESNGMGHATIGGGWHTLTMTPTNVANAFSAIDFNLNVSGANRQNPFFADITLNHVGGAVTVFDNISLGYHIYGNAGETFSSITFTGWRNAANTAVGNFEDIRQIDVETVFPTTGAVPEPATWAMLLIGFGFAGSAMRRRRVTGPSLA
ncbi:MAG: PEPxxWA-CTERM sorting domain-containing protein [Chakrabartia sp.]